MTDVVTTDLSAETPVIKLGYFGTRYRKDAEFAEQQRKRVKAAYLAMPEDKKAELIAKKVEIYKASPEIQERQRRTSREYYHRKKAASQVIHSATSLVF